MRVASFDGCLLWKSGTRRAFMHSTLDGCSEGAQLSFYPTYLTYQRRTQHTNPACTPAWRHARCNSNFSPGHPLFSDSSFTFIYLFHSAASFTPEIQRQISAGRWIQSSTFRHAAGAVTYGREQNATITYSLNSLYLRRSPRDSGRSWSYPRRECYRDGRGNCPL